MQLLLVSKAKKFTSWVFGAIWHLVKRIAKNPLGFIWWAVKMYIALMMLTFCLLVSFGAFAQVVGNDPAIDYDSGFYPPTKVEKTICFGFNPLLSNTDPGFPVFTLEGQKNAYDCTIEATKRYRGDYMAHINKGVVCPATVTSVFPTGWYFQPRYLYTNPATGASGCHPDGGERGASIRSDVQKWIMEDSCPPKPTGNPVEDAKKARYTIKSTAKNGTSTTTQCFKPKPKPNKCAKATDVQIAPVRHFDTSATTDQICVKNDAGELCPFKKQSLGIFIPDTSNPNLCDSGGIPESKEVPPIDCKDMGSGQKICRADPNQKCKVGAGGVQDCDQACGYVQGVFMCIEGEPKNTPLDPLKPVDDTVKDPTKKTPEMDKQDHKDIMKGAEDRLDNVVTGLQNLGKQLTDQQNDGPTKSGQDRGNMYLSSIDKNVAEINKKLDGTKDDPDEDNVSLNPKELDFEHNDFKTRNFGTIIDTAAKALLGKPIFTSIKSYFNASFGGSCPTWSVNVDVYTITIDQLCSDVMNQVWPGIRAIIILVFSFLAFRVAFLD
jgi:hypothetical protein